MRKSYGELIRALDGVDLARACIGQNRGYDKQLAREAYEHIIGEELLPAIVKALDDASGDLPEKAIEKIGRDLLKALEKHDLVTTEETE